MAEIIISGSISNNGRGDRPDCHQTLNSIVFNTVSGHYFASCNHSEGNLLDGHVLNGQKELASRADPCQQSLIMFMTCRISLSPVCRASSIAEHSTPAQGLPQANNKQLRLQNTMTKQLEAVTARPGTDNTIAMYVCGPTTYDYSHIGGSWTLLLSHAAACLFCCPQPSILPQLVLLQFLPNKKSRDNHCCIPSACSCISKYRLGLLACL